MSQFAMQRLPMMQIPNAVQYRPQFAHMHPPNGPPFYPRGGPMQMHNDR